MLQLQRLMLYFSGALYHASTKDAISSNSFTQYWKSVNLNNFRFKSFKKYLDFSNVPTLNEIDLEKQFIRGSGPGGQSINKTSSCVLLKHKPTGIVVKCQETRSQHNNLKIAQEIMINKLDNILNGEKSVDNQKRVLMQKISSAQKRKQKKWMELKKAFKEREDLT